MADSSSSEDASDTIFFDTEEFFWTPYSDLQPRGASTAVCKGTEHHRAPVNMPSSARDRVSSEANANWSAQTHGNTVRLADIHPGRGAAPGVPAGNRRYDAVSVPETLNQFQRQELYLAQRRSEDEKARCREAAAAADASAGGKEHRSGRRRRHRRTRSRTTDGLESMTSATMTTTTTTTTATPSQHAPTLPSTPAAQQHHHHQQQTGAGAGAGAVTAASDCGAMPPRSRTVSHAGTVAAGGTGGTVPLESISRVVAHPHDPPPAAVAPRVAQSELARPKPAVSDTNEEAFELDGGVVFTDEEQLAMQRKVAWDLVKQVGNNLMEGKDLTRVSLPVQIFEPRSFLERVTDYWCYMPRFLPAAAACSDPLERFKLVLAFGMAGLFNTSKQRKPFNPILGETFEASFEDGTALFLEQSSHHPPVTQYQAVGPHGSFQYHGNIQFHAAFRGNSLRGQWSGLSRVTFRDGTEIDWEIPPCQIRGIMWGTRRFNYVDSVTFRDARNGLECNVSFNPDQKGFLKSMFSRAPKPKADAYRGEIMRVPAQPTGGSAATAADRARAPAIKQTKGGKSLCVVQGSWISHLEIDGKKYWDTSMPKSGVVLPANPLPSDPRFREDLQALARDDVAASRELKIMLEEKQRYDARLRKDARKQAKKKR